MLDQSEGSLTESFSPAKRSKKVQNGVTSFLNSPSFNFQSKIKRKPDWESGGKPVKKNLDDDMSYKEHQMKLLILVNN